MAELSFAEAFKRFQLEVCGTVWNEARQSALRNCTKGSPI